MTRKDSEKDMERPHYYSQFWLDVAAGRRTIGTPKSGEDGEIMEPDLDLDEPMNPHKLNHADGPGYSRYEDAITHPEVEPIPEEDELEEEPLDEIDVAEIDEPEEVDDTDIPNILMDNVETEANADADTEIPEEETVPLEEADEDFFDEDEEEEEDEDGIGWSAGRGRKKPKPGRQARVPAPKKGKRERRSY